jgi:hypothetical protein
MRNEIQADGDRWVVRPDDATTTEGVRTFVFHCVSNSSRGYRVVQVPESVAGNADFDERELRDLFDRSQTMDFVHDTDAHPEGHGIRF